MGGQGSGNCLGRKKARLAIHAGRDRGRFEWGRCTAATGQSAAPAIVPASAGPDRAGATSPDRNATRLSMANPLDRQVVRVASGRRSPVQRSGLPNCPAQPGSGNRRPARNPKHRTRRTRYGCRIVGKSRPKRSSKPPSLNRGRRDHSILTDSGTPNRRHADCCPATTNLKHHRRSLAINYFIVARRGRLPGARRDPGIAIRIRGMACEGGRARIDASAAHRGCGADRPVLLPRPAGHLRARNHA